MAGGFFQPLGCAEIRTQQPGAYPSGQRPVHAGTAGRGSRCRVCAGPGVGATGNGAPGGRGGTGFAENEGWVVPAPFTLMPLAYSLRSPEESLPRKGVALCGQLGFAHREEQGPERPLHCPTLFLSAWAFPSPSPVGMGAPRAGEKGKKVSGDTGRGPEQEMSRNQSPACTAGATAQSEGRTKRK